MLEEIKLPQFKTVKKTNDEATFTIEPLHPGYGVTLGNSLRRVLLSSLPGSAVTAIKVKGVSHEFSTIPGVKEDMVEIIMNIKKLHLNLVGDKVAVLRLEAKGEKEVTAGDIKPSSDVEIVNKDLHIATLTDKKAELSIELNIEKGRGYEPVEKREGEKLKVGMIAVDAIYSPVKKVRYDIEHTRVGKVTNLDKLTVDLTTDGSISPQEAMEKASGILIDHFSVILGVKKTEGKKPVEKKDDSKPVKSDDKEKILIEELDLSERTMNALLNNSIKTVGDVKKIGMVNLKNLRGFGERGIEELQAKLDEIGVDA